MIQKTSIMSVLMPALRRLEYRGYDSSGIALFQDNQLTRYRAVGVLQNLQDLLPPLPHVTTGMGHTRWATHGEPNVRNAHPHFSQRVAVVHNGIIENFSALKTSLSAKGYVFDSDTDTEVIAHLIDSLYTDVSDIMTAFRQAVEQLHGHFTIVCMVQGYPQSLLVARRGTPPLLVGRSVQGYSISSDALGLADVADELAYLASDTWALVGMNSIQAYHISGHPVDMEWTAQTFQAQDYSQGQYDHFMRKEIDEQPDVIERLLQSPIPSLSDFNALPGPHHLSLLGCGTSFYAAWVGKYVLEQHYTVTLELASEFSYRRPKMTAGVTLALSQSGETADTLKAVEYAHSQGQTVMSIVNAAHSSLARCSDYVLDMQAGPEIGVASTKAFTAQLWILYALSGIDPRRAMDLPNCMRQTLALSGKVQQWSESLSAATSILYMGRGSSYPVALEGALKMKELSYIHAEGLAAGELKHGSLALVDEHLPILFLAPYDDVFEKSVSNIHEILARKGRVYVVTDVQGANQLPTRDLADMIVLPSAPEPIFNPFLQTLILQLLAYYTALSRGCSIDQPRNLAKSVTVE